MTPLSLISFALVFAAACASPGPTMTALVARVIGRGTGGIPLFCAGLMLGDLVWLAAAVFGLAALAALFQPVFIVLRYLGAVYLLSLAWRMWSATPSETHGPAPARSRHLFLGGLGLALGNPKTMLFYLAILPSVVPLGSLGIAGFGALAAVMLVVYCLVLVAYVSLASRIRQWFSGTRARRLVNRTGSAVIAGVAVLIVSRS